MTAVAEPIIEPAIDRKRLLGQQHLFLPRVSWSFYEMLLEEIGSRALRVTYYRGDIEMMAPLWEHESGKRNIGSLIELVALELNIPMVHFGSATYRRKEAEAGLEPDESYYIQNAHLVRGAKRYDPTVHPAPDLAVEVDITSRSIAREPVYAALGVREIWRYDGSRLVVLLLDGPSKTYRPSPSSAAFAFLPMDHIVRFVHRLEREEQTTVRREFQVWVRTLQQT